MTDFQKPRYNTSFLVGIFLASAVTNISSGFALASFNQSAKVVQIQTGWSDTSLVIITSLGIFGLMMGSLFADKMMTIGRINTIYLANFIIALACVP